MATLTNLRSAPQCISNSGTTAGNPNQIPLRTGPGSRNSNSLPAPAQSAGFAGPEGCRATVNSARVTGMTRYACFWVENGEIVAPIQDMRFDESIYRVFGNQLEALTVEQTLEPDIATYGRRELGAKQFPGALLKEFKFTL